MSLRTLSALIALASLVACGDDSPAGGAGGGGGGDVGGSGGTGAAGGAPASDVRECTADEDCFVRDDCCSCASVPTDSVGACDQNCEQSECSARGIEAEASCIAGQCVFALSCNAATVTCNAMPPVCAEGLVPSVDGLCWGPCVAASECSDVTSCADCGSLVCLDEVAFGTTHHCIASADACPAGPTCECLEELCYQGDICSEGGDADISCDCISC